VNVYSLYYALSSSRACVSHDVNIRSSNSPSPKGVEDHKEGESLVNIDFYILMPLPLLLLWFLSLFLLFLINKRERRSNLMLTR